MSAETASEMGWVPTDDSLAARLMLVRHQKGWTSPTRAERACGLPDGSWLRMEKGVIPRDLPGVVAKIAAVTGASREYLMWGRTTAHLSDLALTAA